MEPLEITFTKTNQNNMITHEQNNRTWWIIPVPENIKCIDLNIQFKVLHGFIVASKFEKAEYFGIVMPEEFTYGKPFLLSEATQDKAIEVVESKYVDSGGDDFYDYYRKYEGSQKEEDFPWISGKPLLSLKSLCKSHYPKHTGDFAIIEQIKTI